MIDESLSWKYHISLSVPFTSQKWNDIEIKPGISYPSIQRIKQIYYNLSSIIFLMPYLLEEVLQNTYKKNVCETDKIIL